MINFHEPYVSKKQKKYLLDVTTTSTYLKDKYKNLCEEFLYDMYGKQILLTHSATAALEISAKLIFLENQKQCKVSMPSYTFSSTANAFLIENHKINFIDINPEDMIVERDALSKIKDYLVVVHYGNSCFDFSNTSHNRVIEDAAQSFDAKLNNKYLGTFGKYGCISFHRTKNIHADYGGLLILNDDSYFDQAKYIYERGTDRADVIAGSKNKYQWVEKGSSYQISELSSALLLSQLESKDKIKQIRKEIYNQYLSQLKILIDSKKIKIQNINKNLDPNYHSFYIMSNENNRQLLNHLNNFGIKAYIGYEPLHLSEFSSKNNLSEPLPITEKVYKQIIRLPLHTNLKKDQIKFITVKIKEFYG